MGKVGMGVLPFTKTGNGFDDAVMKVILATDGSADALAAMAFLKRIGLPERSEVTLGTVVQPIRGYGHTEREQQAIRAIGESVRIEAQAILARGVETFHDQKWQIQTTIWEGDTAEEIISAAERNETDLIVVGARGCSRIQRFLLGSVSQRVVKYAPCSVLIVRAREGQGGGTNIAADAPLRVLVAFDDSEPSRRAVEMLARISRARATDVEVLTVMPTVTAFRMDIQEQCSDSWQAEQRKNEEALRRVEQQLRQVADRLHTTLQTNSNVTAAILDTAEKSGSELIVLGNKGKNAIERFLLGSVSHRVVQHALCPVLVAR